MNDKQQLMALGEEMVELRYKMQRSRFGDWWATNGAALRAYTNEQYAFGAWCARGVELTDVTRQRDELLAALEALVKIIADTPRPDPDDVFATIDEARSVINKVRGEI